jgi:tetratricopeptide (TPR) repeat protein
MKKWTFTTLFFILIPCLLTGQDIDLATSGATYAVVVGISDYQDEKIPDLQYADIDALAFAGYLQSPAGGLLDSDHLRVLVNKDATVAQFARALDWLWDVVKENDRVIIYFSGHGDVEKKSLTQPGYLLCWDAPSRVYMAGGALKINDLKDVVATLSIQNKAKVFLFTDACRAGKLSGYDINGAQLTGLNLSKQFANEIKILSCQPNEYSIEGTQWGGGRGAFSYHLLQGLYGLADSNSDLVVTLKEISRYLEDNISPEVAPQIQNPMTIGDIMEPVAQVIPDVITKLKKDLKHKIPMFAAVEQRGIENDVLSQVDSNIVDTYLLFKKSMENKQFLEPVQACADSYYDQLINEPSLGPLHSSITRNYAAALQDDAQQVMNNWLEGDVVETFLSKTNQAEKYRLYPYYLERAAELLGSDHYMYPTLKARQLYFEGYLMDIDNHNPNQELGEQILTKYRQSLKWQSNSPQTYRSMAEVYFYQLMNTASAEFYTERAMELVPSWITPYSHLGFMYCGGNIPRDLDKARQYLELADKVDTITSHSDISHINNWGIYLLRTKQYEKAIKALTKAIAMDSTISLLNNTLGLVYFQQKKRTDAEELFKKAIHLDSTNAVPYSNLGLIYTSFNRFDEAEVLMQKAIDLDSTNLHSLNYLGYLYMRINRFREAKLLFEEIILLDPTVPGVYGNLGLAYLETNHFKEAEENLLKAIQIDSSMAVTHGGLGAVYMAKRQFGKAEMFFKKAIQLDSTSIKGYINLATIYMMTRKMEEVEELSKKVIQLDPTSPAGYFLLGQLYSSTQRTDEAEQLLIKSIQMDSTIPVAYGALGSIYQKAERWEDAEKQFIKVIQMDTTNFMGYASLGVVYQNLARWEESATMFQKTIKYGPPFMPPYIYGAIGNVYTHVPELKDQAGPMLDNALKMNPNNPKFYIYKAQLAVTLNQIEEAWQFLEQGLEKNAGSRRLKYKNLQSEPDFEEMRKDGKWEELMKKYFLEQFE